MHLTFGSSYKTSDFIVDNLEAWWNSLSTLEQAHTTRIQLKVDNGPESSGVRTQFLKRMVDFSCHIGKTIQLLYFPPYHSKYNPIERCWGILEQHWNGALLADASTMLEWAKTMTWKGIKPIVRLCRNLYEKGISLTKPDMQKVEACLARNPDLPKWDILIEPLRGASFPEITLNVSVMTKVAAHSLFLHWQYKSTTVFSRFILLREVIRALSKQCGQLMVI